MWKVPPHPPLLIQNLTAFVSSSEGALRPRSGSGRGAALGGQAMDWLIYVAASSVLGACMVMIAAGFLKGCR